MKVIQNSDGTISVINEDERPDGFTEELNVESVQSEVPQSLIDECETLCKDGRTRFIFDKHLTNASRKRISNSKKETRDINLDEILLDEYYISDEDEFNLMPSRFPYYDTETKMTCRWTKHKVVTEWFEKLGFKLEINQSFSEYLESYRKDNKNGFDIMTNNDKILSGLYHYYCFYKKTN